MTLSTASRWEGASRLPGAAEVARGVLGVEVAPALERPARPRLDRDHHRLDDEASAPDAVAVGERPDRGEPLPAGNLALDHPVERAAVDDRVEALRHHAGGVGLLVGTAEPSVMGAVLLNPILEVADRIAADAELQQMEGPSRRFSCLDHKSRSSGPLLPTPHPEVPRKRASKDATCR